MKPHDPRTSVAIEAAIARFAANCADEMVLRDVFRLIWHDRRMSAFAESRAIYTKHALAEIMAEIDKVMEAAT